MEKKKSNGRVVHQCPHNCACFCERKTCGSCGWNPAVAKARLDKILKERGV